MDKEKNSVLISSRNWKIASRLITDFPELGYSSVDEFVDDAVMKLLRLKGLEIGKLQTWMKR